MASTSNVCVEWVTSNVALLVLNNSAVHQLSLGLITDVTQIIRDLNEIDKCSAMILTSDSSLRVQSGKRAIFCAGLDLQLLSKNDAALEAKYIRALGTFWDAFNLSAKPIVCALNGDAIAGGALVCCLCDYRIAANDYFVQFRETRLGLDIDAVTYHIALRVAGSHDKASFVTQTAKAFGGAEAVQYGLVNRVVYVQNEKDIDATLIAECLAVLHNDYLKADIGAASTARARGREWLLIEKEKLKIRRNANLDTLSMLKAKVLDRAKL